MRLEHIMETLSYGTLEAVSTLKEYSGHGLIVAFQSNGFLDGASKPKSKFSLVGFGNIGCILEAFPPWVETLRAKAHIRPDKHFIITIKTSNITDGFEWELVDEKLEYLKGSDSYRDGGSLEVTWITNYGNKWSLCLHVATADDVDYREKYSHLYNCRFDRKGGHMPILKDSPEAVKINARIEEWLASPQRSPLTNKEAMKEFSVFQSLYYKMPFRIY